MKLQSASRQNFLRKLHGRTILRRDQPDGADAETRGVDVGDPLGVRRPGRLDIPTLAPRQPGQGATFSRHSTNGALIRDGDDVPVGGDGRLDAAERAAGSGWIRLSAEAECGDAPKPD